MSRTNYILMACFAALVVGGRPCGAHAEGAGPRVFLVPTAELVPPETVDISLGIGGNEVDLERSGYFVSVLTGFGELAHVGVELSDRMIRCTDSCDDEPEMVPVNVPAAILRFGLAEQAYWPGVGIDFRKGLSSEAASLAGFEPLESAELSLVLGKTFGAMWLQLGAHAFAARTEDAAGRSQATVDFPVRPVGAIGGDFGTTTVMGDFSFRPTLGEDIETRWVANGGVRFRALDWLSTELGVRLRQDDPLDGAVIFGRLNLRFDFRVNSPDE